MKFQLISKDEYNQTQIVATVNDVASLFAKAKEYVTTENMENALTADERKTNWKAYTIEVLDEKGKLNKNILYGGDLGGKSIFYIIKKTGVETVNASDMNGYNMRFFIGSVILKKDKVTRVNETDELYAEDIDRRSRQQVLITGQDNENLKNKIVLFVKILK